MKGKICTKCNEYKYLYEYDKQPLNKSRDGFRASCKECNKPHKRKHYQNNKESYRSAFQDFMTRNPDYQKNYYLRKKIPN